jgi:uncharacterized membrane protein YecN with MAPEG domain
MSRSDADDEAALADGAGWREPDASAPAGGDQWSEVLMPIHDPVRRAAFGRLKRRQEFQQNLAAYVVINAFLVGVWAITGAGYFWPAWVLGGWGIGLVMHAWTVYGQKPITAQDVEREARRMGGPSEPS